MLEARVEARVESRTFGRYTLLTKLAAGGMATVYLAHSRGELGFERLVAIKIIHPHLLDQPEFLARFLHEGTLASQIRHPHVVSVLDVGKSESAPYLVLDYVRGASLAELIIQAYETSDPPTLPVACAIVQEALDGLEAVHAAQDDAGRPLGLIHRDISPHNVLVSADGVTYVTDLGIARARGVALTQGTGLLGKAGYIAPEQLAKEPLTIKVDLFAMGVLFWELLTLQRLFEDLEAELGMLTGTFKLVPPSHHNPRVSPELDRFVATLLSRHPDRRPSSAGAAAAELARLVPSAPRTEVAEWVQALASGRLDRLDAVVRDARALRENGETQTLPPRARGAEVETQPLPRPSVDSIETAPPARPAGTPTSVTEPARDPSAGPSRRGAVALALLGVAAGLAGGLAIFSKVASVEPVVNVPALAPSSTQDPAPAAAPSPSPSTSSTSVGPPASAPPIVSARPGTVTGVAPSAATRVSVPSRPGSRIPSAAPHASPSASEKPGPAVTNDAGAAPNSPDPYQRL